MRTRTFVRTCDGIRILRIGLALAAGGLGGLVPGALAAQQQQPVTVTGRVTDQNGRPLSGAEVLVSPPGIIVTTRVDGTYRVTVPAARVSRDSTAISARYLGYQPRATRTILAGRTSAVEDFRLVVTPFKLGEVVVTGAGTVSAPEKLGTVRTVVDSTEIARSNETNLVNSLAAKAPNVTTISQAGDPGASAFLQLRGLTTITAQDGQPLIVVDGVPIDNSTTYNSFNALNSGSVESNRAIDLNPDEIASVEVLKGASSGANYGSRAGQGVILITTKRGQPGPTRYSLRSGITVNQHTQLPALQRAFGLGSGGVAPDCLPGGATDCSVGFDEAGSWGPPVAPGQPTFDHASEMFQNGYTTDNTLTISGGSDRTTFFLSGGYNYDRGIVVGPNNNFRRINVRFNGTQQVFDALKVGANVAYTDSKGAFLQSRNNTAGLLLGAWRTPPTFDNLPFLDPVTGLHRSYRFPNPGPASATDSRFYDNPFFVANENTSTSTVGRTVGNINADLRALAWLHFNYTLGLDYGNDERLEGGAQGSSQTSIPGAAGVGYVIAGYLRNRIVDHNLTATANYTVSPKWSGTLTLGQNLNSTTFQTRQSVGVGLIGPQPFNLGNTSSQQPPFDFQSTIRLESYFAQATADLLGQLYLTAAVRNDGASTFGVSRRRNWYPKGSIAWNFRNGQAPGGSFLGYGKLRMAYGQSGTQPAPYLLQTTLVTGTLFDGGWGPGLTSQQGGQGGLVTNFRAPNPDLGPERVKEFETGIDLGIFGDKADVSLTYYNQHSTNVILDLPVPPSTGFSVRATNAAALRNIGVEAALNVRPVTSRNFSWEIGLQWADNRSRVTDLAGVAFAPFPNAGGTNGLGIQGVAVQGQPLGVYYSSDFVRCGRGLTVGGVDIDHTAGQCLGAPAGALYIDATGYPQLDNSAQYVIGDPNPRWTAGARTVFRFGKLSLTGLVDIRHGGVAYNGTRGALDHFGTAQETATLRSGTFVFGSSYLPKEKVAGPGAGMAVPLGETWFTGAGGVFNGPSSLFLEDGGFIKLREISLGYTLDAPWVNRALGFTSVDLRLAGRNLHTWTSYTGVDPETSLLGAASPVKGIDYFNNPQSRSYVFTVTLNR